MTRRCSTSSSITRARRSRTRSECACGSRRTARHRRWCDRRAGACRRSRNPPLDMVRPEKAGRNARDAYATEHLEIASYELLARVADRAGDHETAAAAREIIADERSMAEFVEQNWDLFADASLREAGVAV